MFCLLGTPAVEAESQNGPVISASSERIVPVSTFSQGGLAAPQVTADGLKILYYVDYIYPGHDTFSAALASMGLLPGTTLANDDDAAMQNFLATEGWHLVITLIQNSPSDRVFNDALIGYVGQGGKAILTDWRGVTGTPAQADALASAFQGTYTGNFNGASVSFIPGNLLWFGLTSPIDIGLPDGVFYSVYALGLREAPGATGAGAFPVGETAIVIGNDGNTLLNGFFQDVFLDLGEGVYLATNELRYLLKSLNVAKTGSGRGTVVAKKTPISCGTTCGADFSAGQLVKLSAKADKGSKFTGWSGACSGTQKTCTVMVGGPGTYKGVTATFDLK
jgi:hypothetical protein